MKNILILTGLNRVQNEDTDDLLRGFLYHEFKINYRIEFGNVHRSKTRTGDNSDLKFALNNGNKLRGKRLELENNFRLKLNKDETYFIPGLIHMAAFDWSMTRWYKTHATGW